MRVCGIDPGSKGAMCILDSTKPDTIALFDLVKATPYDMAKWLFHQAPTKIILEDVHSLYGMSAKSNFNFGRNLGIVQAVSSIISKDQHIYSVTPKKWQKAIGVTSKGSNLIKQEVANLAQTIYPNGIFHGAKGGLLDGRSDATMIAHYALHHHSP